MFSDYIKKLEERKETKREFLTQREIDDLILGDTDIYIKEMNSFYKELDKQDKKLIDISDRSIELALSSIIDIIDEQKEVKEQSNNDMLEINMTVKMYSKLMSEIKEQQIDGLPEFIKNEIHIIDHNLDLFRSHGDYSQKAFDFQMLLFKAFYVLHDAIEFFIENE